MAAVKVGSGGAVNVVVVVVVALLLGLMAGEAAGEVTCSEVTQLLSPCADYLIYGGQIPSDCCAGVKQVKADAKTGEDRRTACTCIQDAAAMIPGLDYNLVASLPSRCGVSLPYKISPSTDCSRIN